MSKRTLSERIRQYVTPGSKFALISVKKIDKVEELEKALKALVEVLPDKCSCHEAYREREKNLGYRFKDPACMFCEYEEEIRAARLALGLGLQEETDRCDAIS